MNIINAIVFPFYLLIITPVEFSCWREYKRQGYEVKNYFMWSWDRMYWRSDEHFIRTSPKKKVSDKTTHCND